MVKLTIPLGSGETWKVEKAEQVGDLAVHKTRNDKEWTVTHIPTSLGLSSAIPEEYKSNKKLLLLWASTIQSALKKDWLMMRKFSHNDIIKNPDRTKAVRDRVRAMCAKTKVE
jgi:hypothetical protein